MQGQAVYGLKVREDLVAESSMPETAEKPQPVKLSVIREKWSRLLDKEAICCNLATD